MNEQYMKRAIELAQKGTGKVNPNPLVGAVIVKGDRIIAEGYHAAYGELHAERHAFSNLTEDAHGASMYVTLEPCCHHGKQPPCTEAIIAHGIKKVYVGSDDPNALVAGKGIKQLAPVGPNGEIIMDYSIHDALEAGFNKVVFIIRKDLEEEFRRVIGERIEKVTEVAYAFQSLDDLPEGFEKPADRTKPWGTGQAVLAAKAVLDEPFMVINADDYYGKEAYVKVHDYLVQEQPEDGIHHICMAGFRLGNTLSDNGSVTRGVCHIEDGALVGVTETHNIFKTADGAEARDDNGNVEKLDIRSLVSMNMWGLTPAFMDTLEKGFVDFLQNVEEGDIKKEYLLPEMIDRLIKDGKAKVDVLETKDTWFGVTYQEDKAAVTAAFKKLVEDGVYPAQLYK